MSENTSGLTAPGRRSVSSASSQDSGASYQSVVHGHEFSNKQRPVSPKWKYVSMRSDRSIGNMPDISNEPRPPFRPVSAASSQASEKSDRSKGNVPNFSNKPRPVSPAWSDVSFKSDHSIGNMPNFSNKPRPVSPAWSDVSLKSDHSIGNMPNFSNEPRSEPSASRRSSSESDQSKTDSPDSNNSQPSPRSVSSALGQVSDPSDTSNQSAGPLLNCSDEQRSEPSASRRSSSESDQSKTDSPDSNNSQQTTQQALPKPDGASGSAKKPQKKEQEKLITKLKERFREKNYKKDTGEKSTEHIILADALQGGQTKAKLTSVSELSKAGGDKPIRTVLTVGEQGMGKSLLVQEFIQEWSKKGSVASWFKSLFITKSDVVIFPVECSELNLKDKVSLVGLLNRLFVETKECVICDYNKLDTVFVLENLNHYKLSLDFDNNDTVTDVNELASVDVILTNLIKGNLLPSAKIWITSHPSAADRIPENLIHRKTQIRDKNAKAELSKRQKEHVTKQHQREVQQETDCELYEIKTEPSGQSPVKVTYSDIFTRSKSRTVLTKGVAGIGKTFHTKKFMVDWGQGKSNTNIDLVIPLHFEKLTQTEISFDDLLEQFSGLQLTSKGCYYDEYKIVIILDGLEKCKLPLDFKNNKEVKDIKVKASVDVLLTNLIQGNLLPSARLWILTQPSAVDKIPLQFIGRATECQETLKRRQKLVSKLKISLNGNFKDHHSLRETEHILRADGEVKKKIKLINTISDLFEGQQSKKIRTVLTTVEQEIGKAHFEQEQTNMWAKTKDESVLFSIKCSKLHLTDKISLVGLLNMLFEDTTKYVISNYDKPNIVFVLDGLDELDKLPLDSDKIETVTDVYEPASVDVILTNLIKGNLLPSARIWMTSRPSADVQIPEKLIHQKTQIRDKDAKDKLSKGTKTKVCEQHQREVQQETDSELYEIKTEPSGQSLVNITYSDIFTRSKSRTVLTKGVAGIGKTFQTKKFMYDWGQGKSNTNIDLVIPLHFEELNQAEISFEHLLNTFCVFKVTKGCYYDEYEIVIILDGLEKCELPLDFENNNKVKDIKVKASVDVLLTNLIEGNLLPSARLWILTQPSAVDKIPSQYIDRVTECQETLKRRQKLVSQLKTSLNGNFQEDITHYNQKNTEHILRADGTEVDKKNIQINIISDLFKGQQSEQIQTVLTTGERDIGKSYLVQKLTNVWAKSESGLISYLKTRDESVLFPIKCSKLNLTKKVSCVGLLNMLFKETKKCVISNYNKLDIVFVLDGLDELEKLPLDFDKNDSVTDVYELSSVDVILTNLIRGNLLPSARIWMTSRPSAAARIPENLIHRKTQIRVKPDVMSQRNLRSKLRDQFNRVAEGVDRNTESAFLKDIYTDLYIIEGERGEVHQQSETRLVQQAKNIEVRKEIPISYKDIFKPSSETPTNNKIKTVLTTGVAGIGKSFASMKYMLDWAEGSANEDTYFTFPLPFRELNLRKDTEQSLEELIHQFFPLMKTSEITNYDQYKIMIVLDGLDECRLDLKFNKSHRVSDIKEKSSVGNLLMNLIQGNLLPKSQIWITSRPAASLCIPADKVDRVTEVRGFNDEQKDEYFRKRFRDKDLAEKILAHVKKSRSIYIMSHIPVFCWIAAKVLEDFEKRNEDQGMPKTLTDLYIHFLLLQCRQANAKYSEEETGGSLERCWNERNKKTVLALGKLAFEELEKGNLLFTEDDLNGYDLNVQEAAVFSGLLTQVVRDDCEAYPKRFFCFVHMSIQEFLGAFYAFHTFNSEGRNVLENSVSEGQSASDFYKTAVDKALKSKNGNWDLFLRFLLGLSLETNQRLFQELLQKSDNTEKTNKETIKYIKAKLDEESSDADMNMNLFHCLNELNDHSLVEDIKKYLCSETSGFENFSASKWSALTFVLLTSDEKLDIFDLKKYLKSEKVLLGMLPVVKVSKTALLSWCGLSQLSCSGLSTSVLTSASSNLTELDLSHNDLLDAGAEKLSDGLKSLHCKVEILRLAGCQITVKGCSYLVTALKSNKSSHLKEVDLSYNHPGEDGKKMLADLVEDRNIKLKEVCVEHCGEQRLKPGLKKYVADLTLDADTASRRLVLSEEKRRAKTWEKVKERTTGFQNDERCRCSQVFCEQELRAMGYWEVEWDGTVGIGVSYKGASKTGVMGHDEKSWSVFCTNESKNREDFEDFKGQQKEHGKNKKNEKIRRPQRKKIRFSLKGPNKMALFLDWEAGTLTYYDVTSGELKHIHTFHTKFKESLVPGFWFEHGSVKLCEII